MLRRTVLTIAALCLILAATAPWSAAQNPEEPSVSAPHRRTSPVRNGNWNDSPYGMNAFHPNGPAPHGHLAHFTDANVERLNAGNIRWVRLMLSWRFCEPSQGQYYWDSLDRVVEACNANGIGISACIFEPPDWALVEGSHWVVRPETLESFGEAIATRYRDRIAAYELDNEAATGVWPKVSERSAAIYVPMLKAVHAGIKRGDPNALVVMTGLWQFPMYFLEDMYKLGAKDHFDVVNMHYYLGGDRDPTVDDPFRGDLDLVLKQIEYVTNKYGDGDKPLWFTEYGWPATAQSQSSPVGEEMMAIWMEYFLEHTMRSGLVEKNFWYVYYLSDGMALWHEEEDYRRHAWYAHRAFQAARPSWGDAAVAPTWEVPPAASRPAEVPGGDLESLDAWQVAEGVQASLASRDPKSGQRYLHMVSERPDSRVAGQTFPLEGGKAYELTGWIRMSGGLQDPAYAHAMIQLELLGEGGQDLGITGPLRGRAGELSTNYYISDTQGQWYQVHYNVFTPPEVRAGRIVLNMGHRDAFLGEADFDDIRMVPLDLTAYDNE